MSRYDAPIDNIKRMAVDHLDFAPNKQATPIERVRFLSLAMAGEAGETANIVKKQWRGDTVELRKYELIKEIADTVAYAFMLSAVLDFNLIDSVENVLIGAEIKLWKKP